MLGIIATWVAALYGTLVGNSASILKGDAAELPIDWPYYGHNVAYRSYAWTDHSRLDPLRLGTSNHSNRVVPFDIFYPVLAGYNENNDAPSPCHPATAVPYLSPKMSAHWTSSFLGHDRAFPDSFLSSLRMPRLSESLHCPFADSTTARSTVLVLSAAGATSRHLYKAMASSLASMGFVVLNLDSLHDADLVELPDGTVVRRSIRFCEFNCTEEQRRGPNDFELATRVRVQDIQFLLASFDRLAEVTSQPLADDGAFVHSRVLQHISAAIDRSDIGVIGHSLGGATAISAALEDSRIAAAINMDGALWSDSKDNATVYPKRVVKSSQEPILGGEGFRNYSKPILLMGVPGHNLTSMPTWSRLWHDFDGPYKRQLQIRGAKHYAYSDTALLSSLSTKNGHIIDPVIRDSMVGRIAGPREFQAVIEVAGFFFGEALEQGKWSPSNWEDLMERWPEVEIVA